MLRPRSREQRDPAYVRFENETGRDIDVVWICHTGDLVKYGTLGPKETIDINTFKTHPWIFIDCKTGEKMKVGTERIFYPSSWREINERLGLNIGQFFRVPIPIILPVFTLRQLTLRVILNSLRNISEVESLELPLNLQNDLQQMHRTKENIQDMYKYRGLRF